MDAGDTAVAAVADDEDHRPGPERVETVDRRRGLAGDVELATDRRGDPRTRDAELEELAARDRLALAAQQGTDSIVSQQSHVPLHHPGGTRTPRRRLA
ncbi:MAG TPA: hypothetical protein VFV35_06175 [Acidimicrobiales bacterium]|nr:hypothetical protein [Acidimicrobiales bacterium]